MTEVLADTARACGSWDQEEQVREIQASRPNTLTPELVKSGWSSPKNLEHHRQPHVLATGMPLENSAGVVEVEVS